MSHIKKQTKEELEKAEQFNKLMQEVGKANAFQIQMPDDFLDTAYDWFIEEEKKANIVFVSRYSGFRILTFVHYLPSDLKKLQHETKVKLLTKLLHLIQMRDKILKEVDSGRRTLVDAIGWMDKIFRKPKYNIKKLWKKSS
jgi:hypothetical protein